MIRLIFSTAAGLVLTAAAFGQNPPTVPPSTPPTPRVDAYPFQIYRMPDVAKALSITETQVNRLDQATERLQTRYRAEFDKLRDLPADLRDPRVVELLRAYQSEWIRAAGQILTTAQYPRYRQLELQFRGFGAFADPDIQKQLNLSQEQVVRLHEALAWSVKQMHDIAANGDKSRDKGATQFANFQRAARDRLNQVLTTDQQQAWQKMTGPPFPFPPPGDGFEKPPPCCQDPFPAKAGEGRIRQNLLSPVHFIGPMAAQELHFLPLNPSSFWEPAFPHPAERGAAMPQMIKALDRPVRITTGPVSLDGNLFVPPGAIGVVVFAHGSGSSRHSPRNRAVAEQLHDAGLGTLLFDLLTADEEAVDARTAALRFDIALLADRLVGAADWLAQQPATARMPIGFFGASTGGGAALVASAQRPGTIGAVVSRGGRPDLAGAALPLVWTPTLLIVGGRDEPVIEMNQDALRQLAAPDKQLVIVPGATHLFEEPGALEEVARLASEWFTRHLDRDAAQKGRRP